MGALHDQPSLLVLAGVQQQAALVEEGQPLGAVVASHLNAQRAPVIVACQAALQREGVAALQTAVACGGQWQPPLGGRCRKVRLVAGQQVLAVEDFVEGLHQAGLCAGDHGARAVDDGGGLVGLEVTGDGAAAVCGLGGGRAHTDTTSGN